MPSSEKDRPAAGARIPRWKLGLMVLACPALAALAAWLLHKSLVHPDPSTPGEVWLALAMLLIFGVFTAALPLLFRANRRLRRQAPQRMPSRTPQPLTIDIPNRFPIRILAVGILVLAVSVLTFVAGFEGVGSGSAELFIFGLIGTVFLALLIPTYALQRWNARGVRWQIRIDADGIRDSRLGQFLISWSDVMSIRRWTFRGQPFIAFGLRNPAAYRKALNPLGRRWARVSGVIGSGSYTLGLYAPPNIEEGELIDGLCAFKPAGVAMTGFPEAGTGSS